MKNSTRNISAVIATVIQMTLAVNASAAVLTFEDSHEFSLTGFKRANVTPISAATTPIYASGVVSGQKAGLVVGAYGSASIQSTTYKLGGDFDFNGVYMTAINGEGLAVRVEGSTDGSHLKYSKTVELVYNQPVYYEFNFQDIDSIRFITYWIDGPRTPSPIFVLDDFTYNEPFTSTSPDTPGTPTTPVPEPMTLALFGIGLAGMAAGQHRKTRSGAKIATRAPGIC